MKSVISNIFCLTVALFILFLPLIIFIIHFFYTHHYLLYVNEKNISEIITILEEDKINLQNKHDIKKIELWDVRLSRYSNLKIFYDSNEVDEYYIKEELSDYKIIEYLDKKGVNIDEIITILNYLSIILSIILIVYSVKVKK